MMRRPMKWTLPAAIFLASAFAAYQPSRPPCNERNRGLVWKKQGPNDDCAQLEVCSLDVWKYRWQRVTVPVAILKKDASGHNGCEVPKSHSSGSSSDEHLK